MGLLLGLGPCTFAIHHHLGVVALGLGTYRALGGILQRGGGGSQNDQRSMAILLRYVVTPPPTAGRPPLTPHF